MCASQRCLATVCLPSHSKVGKVLDNKWKNPQINCFYSVNLCTYYINNDVYCV